jgi:hypothetical protein
MVLKRLHKERKTMTTRLTPPSSCVPRLRRYAQAIHDRGAYPTFHLLSEIVAASSNPNWHLQRIAAYAGIDTSVLDYFDGRDLPPHLWIAK